MDAATEKVGFADHEGANEALPSLTSLWGTLQGSHESSRPIRGDLIEDGRQVGMQHTVPRQAEAVFDEMSETVSIRL